LCYLLARRDYSDNSHTASRFVVLKCFKRDAVLGVAEFWVRAWIGTWNWDLELGPGIGRRAGPGIHEAARVWLFDSEPHCPNFRALRCRKLPQRMRVGRVDESGDIVGTEGAMWATQMKCRLLVGQVGSRTSAIQSRSCSRKHFVMCMSVRLRASFSRTPAIICVV
jgi:hypothetical protein